MDAPSYLGLCCGHSLEALVCFPEPSCSKLTMSLVNDSLKFTSSDTQIQWNLGNSNANFSKLPDFSKTTDGPEFFHYNLLQKYHRFFEFQFLEKINFSNRFVGPKQRNSY